MRKFEEKLRILIIIVSCLFAILSANSAIAETTQPAKQIAKIVVLKLDGKITEVPPGLDLGVPDLKFNLLWNYFKLLRTAANDDEVRAVVLLVNKPELNLAQCQQFASELQRIRSTGKRIYVHSDSIGDSLYQLELPADVIAMSPGSMLQVNGISISIIFYKSLMAKLGIEANIEALGEYKLAGAPFTASQPSQQMKDQMNELMNDLYSSLLSSISRYRNVSVKEAGGIVDEGPFLAQQAKKIGLIDRTIHREAFLREVKKIEHGRLIFDYGQKKPPSLKNGFGGLMQIFSMLGSKGRKRAGDAVAVVYMNGMIVEGASEHYFGSVQTTGSESMRRVFSGIRKNSQIKAVVVRINSPGGSSAASEIIAEEIKQTAKTKPVIISMGGEAASGGYFIAAAGDYIFASPSTLTGSIGVISGKPIIRKLLKKIHLHVYTVSRGKNANMFSSFTPLTLVQRKAMRARMLLIRDSFERYIRSSRGKKIADLNALATGKVFTGSRALKLGLIDKMGTLTDAVALAAKRAHITEYHVLNLPKPESLADLLLKSMGYKIDEMQMTSNFYLRMLDVNPGVLIRTRKIVDMLRKETVLAISPYYISIK